MIKELIALIRTLLDARRRGWTPQDLIREIRLRRANGTLREFCYNGCGTELAEGVEPCMIPIKGSRGRTRGHVRAALCPVCYLKINPNP